MADQPPTAPTGETTPAHYAALPLDEDHIMDQPRAPYLSETQPASSESPRESYIQRDSYLQTPGASQTLLPAKVESEGDERFGFAQEDPAHGGQSSQAKRRRLLPLAIGLLALVIVVLAVILPVYFTVIKPRNNKSSSAAVSPHSTGQVDPNSPGATPSGSGAAPASTPVVAEAIFGGDGSTVKGTNGTTFTYNNAFGGICEFFKSTSARSQGMYSTMLRTA
jgi:glucan 1,3-beta-glucosidase